MKFIIIILILTIKRLLVYQTQHATATSTMVFTAIQTTAFFTEAGQLAITLDTRAQLAMEGIETVDDRADFDDESLMQIT